MYSGNNFHTCSSILQVTTLYPTTRPIKETENTASSILLVTTQYTTTRQCTLRKPKTHLSIYIQEKETYTLRSINCFSRRISITITSYNTMHNYSSMYIQKTENAR